MASRFESALITRVVDSGDFKGAKGVLSDHFFAPENRTAWSYLARYFVEHGITPSRDIVDSVFPGFEWEPLPDPVSVIAERLTDHYVYNQVALHIEKTGTLVQTDVKAAVKMVMDDAIKLRTLFNPPGSTGINITTQVDEEIDAYYRRNEGTGLLGMPYPWARMNEATLGIRNGQLVIFYGRPKSQKTWTLLYVLKHIFETLHKRIVIFTREMSVPELRQRVAALWAEIDYGRYMKGRLHSGEETRWLEAMEAFREMPPFIIEGGIQGSGEDAAEEVVQRAKDYEAELIAVDGVYFFGNREWDEIGKFTSRLKYHLLNTLNLPCIGTTQGKQGFSMQKKGSANAEDVGYSDTFSQDADVLVKQAHVEEDERIYMSVAAIREGKGARFQIWAKPAYDYSQAYVEEDEDVPGDKEKSPGVGDMLVSG